jgi:hypothetical protein
VACAHVEQAKLYRRFVALFDKIGVLISPAASVSPFQHANWSVSEIVGLYQGDTDLLTFAHGLERGMVGDSELALPVPDLAKLSG